MPTGFRNPSFVELKTTDPEFNVQRADVPLFVDEEVGLLSIFSIGLFLFVDRPDEPQVLQDATVK